MEHKPSKCHFDPVLMKATLVFLSDLLQTESNMWVDNWALGFILILSEDAARADRHTDTIHSHEERKARQKRSK